MKWNSFLQPFLDFGESLFEPTGPAPEALRETARHRSSSGSETEHRQMMLDIHRVEYRLIRRAGKRGIALRIDGHGLSAITARSTAVTLVEDTIRQHGPWVRKKLVEWSARRVELQRWENGATIPFLGEHLVLHIDATATRSCSERSESFLRVRVVGHDASPAELARRVEDVVVKWFRRQALPHFAERTRQLAQAHGYAPSRILVSGANGRWGSCNSRGEIRLSWRLMKARPELIDYVICHELAHLRHMNHSRAFWQEVARMCPNHEALKTELDQQDHRFRGF